jgi:ubiquinone/menaquinone biosynthesis C-methylase UbiE
LPFEDKSFDKVYSSLVFHQLDSVTKLKCLLEINRILKPEGELIIGDWGKAKTKWMRFSFYLVQLLDGFKTTNDNVNGLMIKYISDARFKNVEEIDHINTSIGTYSYYLANKINYKSVS